MASTASTRDVPSASLRGHSSACAAAIEAIGLAPPALSRHLRTLKANDLIQESHPVFDARVRIYTLRTEPMAELRTWLEQTEQLWALQLTAFKVHLEARENVGESTSQSA